MYKDSCERNAIEGRNRNSKRRFGLDRIFSKLDETAKTEAALILLAMNASLRLARWLALFPRSLLLPFQFLCFSVGPNYETVIDSFRQLLKTYPAANGKRIYLILDNASWHKKAVRLVQTQALPEYQDIRDKMTLIFLPPYSPDLNPIEQVWRITRRKITHNTYFANAQILEDTLDAHFATYRQPNDKLAALCTFKREN